MCTTVRLVDDQPWSLSVTSIGAERFPGLAKQWTGEASLFDFLLEHHGVRMQRAYRTFSAGLAEPAEAEHLQVRIGAPLSKCADSTSTRTRIRLPWCSTGFGVTACSSPWI